MINEIRSHHPTSCIVTGTEVKNDDGTTFTEMQPHRLVDLGNKVILQYIVPDDAEFYEEEGSMGPAMYRLFGCNWREKTGWCKRFSASEHKTMAHVMHAAGLFSSIGEARRNGWDKPTAVGTYFAGKGMNKKMIVVENG